MTTSSDVQTITLDEIAVAIGLKKTTTTLPNGKVVNGYNFESERDSERVFKAVEKMVDGQKPVILDGPFPLWLLATVVHALHPRVVSVNNLMLGNALPCSRCQQSNETDQILRYGDGDVIISGTVSGYTYYVTVIMAANVRDPLSVCSELKAPALPSDVKIKSVIIEGRAIGAIIAQLSEAYAHSVKDVSVKGVDRVNTVVVTHGGLSYGQRWKD
jgi:hypothetical protein